MIEKLELQVLSMADYYQVGFQRRRHLIPDQRGLYIWTTDISRLASFTGDGIVEELHRIIQTTRRQFEGRVEPYYQISIHDKPNEMTARKAELLKQLLTTKTSHREFFLLASSVLQRPLYVGKAKSLKQRIRGHLRRDSRLMSYLKDANLTIEECCLSFILLPDLVTAQSDYSLENDVREDDDSAPDDFEDSDQDDFDQDFSEFEDDELDDAIASPNIREDEAPRRTETAVSNFPALNSGSDLDILEALVIRMSRPLLVRKQE